MVDVQPRFSTEVLANPRPQPTTWNHNTMSYPQVVKQTTQHFVHIRMKRKKNIINISHKKKSYNLTPITMTTPYCDEKGIQSSLGR